MKYLKVVIVMLVSLTWGCSSITVDTDFDPEIDFSAYKTYVWYTGETAEDDQLAANPLVKKRVMLGVDNALEAKGYSKGTQDGAEFVILVQAGSKERMQVTSYGHGGYGYGRYRRGSGWGGTTQTDVTYYDETTLIIDIIDLDKKALAWRGTGSGIVKKYDNQEEMQEGIDNVVAKILTDFPPDVTE